MPAIIVDKITKVCHFYDSPTAWQKEALHPLRKKYHHDFYVLKDVSVEIITRKKLLDKSLASFRRSQKRMRTSNATRIKHLRKQNWRIQCQR